MAEALGLRAGGGEASLTFGGMGGGVRSGNQRLDRLEVDRHQDVSLGPA